MDRNLNDLEGLYHYGYGLMLDGQISKARYPLHFLYYHCQEIKNRRNDESGRPLYPAQTIAMYSYMAAYMSGDFPAALREYEEFVRQYARYQDDCREEEGLMRKIIQDSYDEHYKLRRMLGQMSGTDVVDNYFNVRQQWKEFLASGNGNQAYIARRGYLQVLLDLHTCFGDLTLQTKQYDELIRACQEMLTICRDSGMVKTYMARACAMKGEMESAARYYAEAAAMLRYEYPGYPDGRVETRQAKREREQIKKEMRAFGLDETMADVK